jgi:pimeloyl-ACP methyl ester carboxylesterase
MPSGAIEMERLRLRARGLVFDVLAAGPPRGEPVVLLHGFPQTAACWIGVAETLAAARYRVLAPDQRGYSLGARPAAVRAYRMPELVADVLALAEELGRSGSTWSGTTGAGPAADRGPIDLTAAHPTADADQALLLEQLTPDIVGRIAQDADRCGAAHRPGPRVGTGRAAGGQDPHPRHHHLGQPPTRPLPPGRPHLAQNLARRTAAAIEHADRAHHPNPPPPTP